MPSAHIVTLMHRVLFLLLLNLPGGLDAIKDSVANFCVVEIDPFQSAGLLA